MGCKQTRFNKSHFLYNVNRDVDVNLANAKPNFSAETVNVGARERVKNFIYKVNKPKTVAKQSPKASVDFLQCVASCRTVKMCTQSSLRRTQN